MIDVSEMYLRRRKDATKQIVSNCARDLFDLGYLGVEKDFPEQLSALPYKKKRNQYLSKEEKDYNVIHPKRE